MRKCNINNLAILSDAEVVFQALNFSRGTSSRLELVEQVYHCVVNHIVYDHEKDVGYDYVPDVDVILRFCAPGRGSVLTMHQLW